MPSADAHQDEILFGRLSLRYQAGLFHLMMATHFFLTFGLMKMSFWGAISHCALLLSSTQRRSPSVLYCYLVAVLMKWECSVPGQICVQPLFFTHAHGMASI